MAQSVAIIGAAIAGPAAAFRLAKLGYHVTVIEARPSNDLVSAGILGITPGNWNTLESFDIPVSERELDNGFREYGHAPTYSPFRYITWTGLHESLVSASREYGAVYEYEHYVTPETIAPMYDYVVEATGVAGAARLMLPHVYSGTTIYRGLSTMPVGEAFITYHLSDHEYFTIGDTPDGAFWAFFVKRPMPMRLTTVSTMRLPREYRRLPEEFHAIMEATPEIFRSPLSAWHVPPHMHNDTLDYFTIGDANGPVWPVTTSGANLAVMEGLSVHHLVGAGGRQVVAMEREALSRRAYDLQLGLELSGPEIGGLDQDTMYALHHANLFPGEYA